MLRDDWTGQGWGRMGEAPGGKGIDVGTVKEGRKEGCKDKRNE